ncbi:MAG: YgiQ family radical SAM protein [Pirellulales bacterium]|nr:YgiQ family radical SAM protein [Pirellulales bacterium]MBL7181634.1 YgiQ family radical SAM protein [Pirellulales bacterium]
MNLPIIQTITPAAPPLPMHPEDVIARGWDSVDIVFVTGDAYVDHPSFANGLLARLLESEGFRIAVLAQPNWQNCHDWRQFGRPNLFFAISAGNMDSMINHYTANRKVRNDDAYSPGGEIGLRPDRATLAYCQRSREAFPGVPIVAGGVEASLRRIAHYDYWSDKVRRSILLDSKADLLAFGMGERTILDIAKGFAAGKTVHEMRALRGVGYRLGASESFSIDDSTRELPAYEATKVDHDAFCEMTRISHLETNPHNAKRLVQRHGREAVVINPPALPLEEHEMDRVYALPFTRRPHPRYGTQRIPAFEVVENSVQIMRGCFGGCTFCSITAHEGRIIQSRSKQSILTEVKQLANQPDFKGTVSDIGGPTANMYKMCCIRPEVEAKCRRLSCVHPTVCKLLGTDHGPLKEVMRETRSIPGVKRVLVASGVRMDLARRDPEYLRELAEHHVGGHLKVAPEHTDPDVLDLMKKPPATDYVEFDKAFRAASRRVGKRQYTVPYFIASHPGSGLSEMIDLALFLKRNGYKPDQVQDFIPSPFDIAACMYHTGRDPMTGKPVTVTKGLRNRRMQKALLQFFKPENYFEVRKALEHAGRQDLIGSGCDSLIPDRPPQEALNKKRREANQSFSEQKSGDHIRGLNKTKKKQRARVSRLHKTVGYRPKRSGNG